MAGRNLFLNQFRNQKTIEKQKTEGESHRDSAVSLATNQEAKGQLRITRSGMQIPCEILFDMQKEVKNQDQGQGQNRLTSVVGHNSNPIPMQNLTDSSNVKRGSNPAQKPMLNPFRNKLHQPNLNPVEKFNQKQVQNPGPNQQQNPKPIPINKQITIPTQKHHQHQMPTPNPNPVSKPNPSPNQSCRAQEKQITQVNYRSEKKKLEQMRQELEEDKKSYERKLKKYHQFEQSMAQIIKQIEKGRRELETEEQLLSADSELDNADITRLEDERDQLRNELQDQIQLFEKEKLKNRESMEQSIRFMNDVDAIASKLQAVVAFIKPKQL